MVSSWTRDAVWSSLDGGRHGHKMLQVVLVEAGREEEDGGAQPLAACGDNGFHSVLDQRVVRHRDGAKSIVNQSDIARNRRENMLETSETLGL